MRCKGHASKQLRSKRARALGGQGLKMFPHGPQALNSNANLLRLLW